MHRQGLRISLLLFNVIDAKHQNSHLVTNEGQLHRSRIFMRNTLPIAILKTLGIYTNCHFCVTNFDQYNHYDAFCFPLENY